MHANGYGMTKKCTFYVKSVASKDDVPSIKLKVAINRYIKANLTPRSEFASFPRVRRV